MKKNPFFDVIIPTYNRFHFLKIAVDSVLAQSFQDYHLTVIDDGSSDKTKKLISSRPDPRIRYYYQHHQGPAAARNLGISKSKAEYICFLDSDDRFRVDKLKKTYDYIKKNPKYKIFHTEEVWYRNGKLLEQKKYHQKPSGLVFREAVRLCSISISTVALAKDIFKDIGTFDQSLPACEDYDFWLKATSKYPIYLIPEFLTIKEGGHPDQQSKKYPALDKFRIYALQKILEDGNLTPDKYKIAYNQLKHKCLIYIKGAKKRKKTDQIKKYQDILNKYQR